MISIFWPKDHRSSLSMLSYWQDNSYYPRGPLLGKGNSSNPKNGWHRGFSVPGAFKLDHLHSIKLLLNHKFIFLIAFPSRNCFLMLHPHICLIVSSPSAAAFEAFECVQMFARSLQCDTCGKWVITGCASSWRFYKWHPHNNYIQ